MLCISPPKDDPISVEELKQYNGTDESKPVYVAVKGTVFDVSPKREMYGTSSFPTIIDFTSSPSHFSSTQVLTLSSASSRCFPYHIGLWMFAAPGKGYHIFAGKDGSRGLGMSSLKPEDAVPDYSTLDDKQLKVLDDWVSALPPLDMPREPLSVKYQVRMFADTLVLLFYTPRTNSTHTTPSATTLSARSHSSTQKHCPFQSSSQPQRNTETFKARTQTANQGSLKFGSTECL